MEDQSMTTTVVGRPKPFNSASAQPHTRGTPIHRVYGYGIAAGLEIEHRTRTRCTRTHPTRGVLPTRVIP